MSKLPKKPAEVSYNQIIQDQILKELNRPIYCSMCGKLIIHCSNDNKSTFVRNWEIKNEACWECFEKFRSERS